MLPKMNMICRSHEIFICFCLDYLAAILFGAKIRPLPVVRFWTTFSMLFSRPNGPENQHKTFSCNFLGVHRIYFVLLPD